jgi:hypothetical protein
MTGIILSLVATLAALIFAFHSDDAFSRADKRLQDCERRIARIPDDFPSSAKPNSKNGADEHLNHGSPSLK